ncbi:MAG: HAD family hydrolase [Chloroflexi bacterium]|nr:HAD family hydrolase [Chloroflexota bacterium]
MKLIIFDLDQTLVDFISIHDEATRRLFREFFNLDARLTEIDFPGKSLAWCFRELAALKKVPPDLFQTKSRHLLGRYDTIFCEILPKEEGEKHILPGARDLLDELAKTEHLVMLYTGDSREIVEAVFRVTGLGKYFRDRFYGTEAKDRAEMVKMAIARAKELTGKKFEGKDIVIIGDSVRDVECGRLFNALTITVTTGFHSREQISEAGADFVFDDLRNTEQVMTVIEVGVAAGYGKMLP